MSDKHNIMQNIISLHNMIISQHNYHANTLGIEKMNRLINEINEVGYIEGVGIKGIEGRYFLIDGESWQHACRNLEMKIFPSFVMWEESDFYAFLESVLQTSHQDKSIHKQ